uniref:Uncharacterized protein n=1 Tax=Takifugu rubripes TaxID=31033 RepID=A0A3B5K9M5_TAKRU
MSMCVSSNTHAFFFLKILSYSGRSFGERRRSDPADYVSRRGAEDKETQNL